MSEWYEELTDEQIERAKKNVAPVGLMDPIVREIMNQAPLKDREVWLDGEWMKDGGTDLPEKWQHVVFRLRPDWERPLKKKWIHDDVPLDESGFFPCDGCERRWNDNSTPRLPGYVGVLWEWRGYQWCEDGYNIQRFRNSPSQFGNWLSDPSVEPPHPVAVRFRREVESE